MRLLNKVALITGSGSGIGRESAIIFSREGAKISIADIDKKGGQQTVDLIKQKGGTAIFIQTDVSKANDVEKMIKTTVDHYGKLDILFNHAGVPMSFTPVEELEEDLWDRIMDTNVKSIFLACKYGVPFMKKQGGGVIINTASIGGVRPRPGISAYNTSKGAIITLTKALAVELAPNKIRVNCINPVAAETLFLVRAVTGGSTKDEKYEEGIKRTLESIPLGRLAQPEDVAYAALYLASDDSSMVTGVSLNVDGGRGI
jgi:3-oxoacyl-[acyl-carrier protein] reductase